MQTITKIFDVFLKHFLIFLMAALVTAVSWQVISRYVFTSPSSWTEEVARFLLIWVGVLGAAYAFRTGVHLGLDVLPKKLTGKAAESLKLFTLFMVAAFAFAVLVIGGGNLVVLTWELKQYSAVLGLPIAFVYSVIPITGILICFYALASAMGEEMGSQKTRLSRGVSMVVFILVSTFVILFALGVPIAFSLGLSTVATMLVTMDFMPAVTTIAQRMAGGINSFALLAIPLFILSGLIMAQGGIARRVIDFSKAVVGSLPGGLAFVNVVSCMLFGAISGSAVAATSAIGGFMIPEMNKAGYDKNFNAAVTATAATTGMLIPPSNILIVYAVASGGVSIAALFVAGYVPGILVGLSLMGVCAVYAKKHNFPAGVRVPFRVLMQCTVAAIPSLFLIVLVIGGILAGIFTATEAGAIAVLYALVLSMFVYRQLSLSQLKTILLKSAQTTAIVMFLIGTSMAMSWLLAYENIPTIVADALVGLSDNPFVILLLINLVLLMVGIFMDMTPAVLIFTPIFLPVAVQLGMSPLHFGIMMVLNLCIGLCTPPVGSILFVSCAIAKTSISQIVRPMMPMYVAMFLALMMVTYLPELSEALPRFFGLID